MANLIDLLNSIIWSKALIILCLGAGLYFSVATRFLQVRHARDMFKYLFGGGSSEKGVSSFQAFAMAVSGRVGTGNIAGVATAIALGGPGAIFWMWVIAFLGAGSAYAEAALAQLFKVEVDGQYRGGPAYYIEKGLGWKWYAVIFALCTIVGTGICLPGIQSNSIGVALEQAFQIDPAVSGAIVVTGLGLIIFGGVKRIGLAAQMLVPFMAGGYIILAIIVILANSAKIPGVVELILVNAFAMKPAFGGMLGMAISWGVKRGIYSNEAGQGTAPMAAAAAEVKHPATQGLVQAFSVYFDTWFVCTATAFMILVTGSYNVKNPAGGFHHEGLPGVEEGPQFTQAAVNSMFPGFGDAFVAIALFFFAFTTLMAYYYYTENNVAYLLKKDGRIREVTFTVLKLIFLGVVFLGTAREASLAWAMGDLGVGLMAWVNIIAILILSPLAIRCLRDFEKKKARGEDPTFHSDDIKVKGADFWEK